MESPVIAKQGQFKLSIASSESTTEFEKKFNIKCDTLEVPYICAPSGLSVSDKSGSDLVGYCALIVNTSTNSHCYAIVGDVCNDSDWGRVSHSAAYSLGFTNQEILDNSQSLKSNFIIYLLLESRPTWSTSSSLLDQIQSECGKRVGYSATVDTSDPNNVDYINHTQINPYIICIDRNTGDVDYDLMKSNEVVGVIIEAGSKYDVVHLEQTYRNPKLKSQVQAALAANMPYGLFTHVRARSVAEADAEIKEMSSTIRLYPPTLGVWLKLSLIQSKSTNNAIIDRYYNELKRLGLSDSVGLYATRSQIALIDWERHSKQWYLWLDEKLSAVSNLEELITPQLFSV